MTSKKERLKLFLDRVEESLPASSAEEALFLLSTILNAVEDAYSGVPREADPEGKVRMGPLQEDNRRAVAGRPSLKRYRSAKHNTFIGANGSIRIEQDDGKVLLNKPGHNGRKTHDLDADGNLA